MKKLLTLWTVVGTVALMLAAGQAVRAAEETQKKDKIFELRVYITHPGKLPDLNKRFRDHTCRLFQKHGIEVVGFWTPTVGPEAEKSFWIANEGPDAENTLIYIVAFPSVEAQKKAWKGFASDPEWKKVFADSHKNGIIVKKVLSKTMKATDYSPMR